MAFISRDLFNSEYTGGFSKTNFGLTSLSRFINASIGAGITGGFLRRLEGRIGAFSKDDCSFEGTVVSSGCFMAKYGCAIRVTDIRVYL